MLSCKGSETAGKIGRKLIWPDYNHHGNVIKTKIGEEVGDQAGKAKI